MSAPSYHTLGRYVIHVNLLMTQTHAYSLQVYDIGEIVLVTQMYWKTPNGALEYPDLYALGIIVRFALMRKLYVIRQA